MILSLTGGLRAGLSLNQALALAAADTPPPLGPEVRRCTEEVRLGLSWAEALDSLRCRLPGEGLTLLVWALAVHRRTGGDLPALCDRLHDLLGERRRLRAKLAAATAQSRLSAGVVAVVPFFLALTLRQLAPDYLAPLLHTPAGWALLTWAGLMDAVGVMLILRLSTLKW
ncbi:MAG: type II secretion system F family protein [Bacillota bacterium]|nr:type II secretion system F family protein [Bacillota bacterium]